MTEQEWLDNILEELKDKLGHDCQCVSMSARLPAAMRDPLNNRYLIYSNGKLIRQATWNLEKGE